MQKIELIYTVVRIKEIGVKAIGGMTYANVDFCVFSYI